MNQSEHKLIDFPCPICGGKKTKLIYHSSLAENELPIIGYDYKNLNQKKTFSYCKCHDCDHIYASPRINDLYKFYIDKEDEEYTKNSNFRRKTYSKAIEILKSKKESGDILEIGSGMGDFIYAAQNFGYKCTGLEISKFSSSLSIKLGHKIFNCNLDDLKKYIGDKKFDIIVMMGVIEHLEYPDKVIKDIKKFLRDDGLVMLWTGDFNSIYSKILRKNWWYVIGQHIQLFTRNSLRVIFNNNNFDCVYNGNLPYIFHHTYLDFHLKRFFLYRKLLRFIIYPFFVLMKEIKLSLSSEILMIFKLRKD